MVRRGVGETSVAEALESLPHVVSLGRIAFDQEDRASGSLGRAHFEGCILHTVTKCSRSYRRAASGRAKKVFLASVLSPERKMNVRQEKRDECSLS